MTDETPWQAARQIGDVAHEFGVSIRTLHHYEAIGLVVPSARTSTGYRLYLPDDVVRLARVVILRRLEVPLAEIATALEGDMERCLRRQRESVTARIGELGELVRSIDAALEAEMSEYQISTTEMKEIFGDRYDESYDAEARERWGETDAWKQSRERTSAYTKDDWLHIKEEGDAVMERFAALRRAGHAPDSSEADQAVQAHRDHIEKWFNDVPLPMLRGMGCMYAQDERFAKTYDAVEAGLATYVSAAVAAYCAARADGD